MNALSVVLHLDLEALRGSAETDSDFRRMRVFHDVVEGFFDRQEQVMPLGGRERDVRNRVGQIESTGNVCGAEVGLRLVGHEGG